MSPSIPAARAANITSDLVPQRPNLDSQEDPCKSFDPTQVVIKLVKLYKSSPPDNPYSWIEAFPYSTSAASSSTAYYWLKYLLADYQPQFSLNWTYAIGMNDDREYEPIPRTYLTTTVCGHTYLTDLTGKLHIVWPLLNYQGMLEDRYLGIGAWLFNSPADFVDAYVREDTLSLFASYPLADIQFFPPDHPYRNPTFTKEITAGEETIKDDDASWQASRYYHKLRQAFGLY